jgi:hypothetical protein
MRKEKSPMLGTWQNVYILIIVVLVATMFLLQALTQYYK